MNFRDKKIKDVSAYGKETLVVGPKFVARRLWDKQFRSTMPVYIRQALLAVATFGAILFFLDVVTHAAIIAAFGSTAFIVFVSPRSRAASTRSVVGGHAVGIGIGIACDYLLRLAPLARWSAESNIPVSMVAGLAVGLTLMAMVISDTKHAPAAGTALGFAIQPWNYPAIIFILVGSAVLSLVRYILLRRQWIRNLT